MVLRLRDITGKNYFSIYPAEVDKSLASIVARAQTAQEDGLEGLKLELGGCIGYRAAQQLTTPQEVMEAAQEERARLLQEKAFLQVFFGEALRAAESEAKASGFNPQREIERDAIFHTLARSGVLVLPFLRGRYTTEEAATELIHEGRRILPDYVNKFPPDVDLIALSMVDSIKRKELLRQLKREFNLPPDVVGHIDETFYFSSPKKLAEILCQIESSDAKDSVYKFLLDRRDFEDKWQEFTEFHHLPEATKAYLERELKARSRALRDSQPFRLAEALRRLLRGNKDIAWVLSPTYQIPDHYNLGYFISRNVRLRERKGKHFHTPAARKADEVAGYMRGDVALSQNLLAYLSELTGEDGFGHVTRWSLSNGPDLIHPKLEIDDATLGAVYGSFLARASEGGHSWAYILHNLPIEELSDTAEMLGRLSAPLKPPTQRTRVNVPKQIANVYQTVREDLEHHPERYLGNKAFATAALQHYVKNKGHPAGTGYNVFFGDAYAERIMRQLATVAGLSISKGPDIDGYKRCYVSNPEAVGVGAAR